MHRKTISKLLAAALALAQLFISYQPALAEGERDLLQLAEPLVAITDASFKAHVTDSGGVTTEVVDYNSIPQNASIEIQYAFDVLDSETDEVKSGDYFSIALPSALTNIASFEPVADRALTIEWAGETYTIGYLNITAGGVATVTFASGVEQLSDVSTSFTIKGNLVDANIGNDSGITFTLWAEGEPYVIDFEDDPVIPDPPDATIEKTGVYDATSNEIIWTITVNSGGPDITIDDVIVIDTIGANQTYKSCSLDPGSITANSATEYAFTLGSVTDATSFTVKTTPTDGAFGAEGSTASLTNDADLYIVGIDDPIDTSGASVDITTDWVKKSGTARSDGGVYYIDWTITLNNNYRTIPAGATLTDAIPTYLELDAATVRRNAALPSAFGDTSTLNGQDFTYTFGADATGVQTITFTTRVLDGYYTQQSQTGFTNTAILHIGAGNYGATSGNVSVGTSLIAKQGRGYDAANQLVTWRIEANRNGRDVTAATITDTLGADQIFDESFGITRLDGSTSVDLTRVDSLAAVTSDANQYYYDAANRVLTIYLGNLAAADHPYLTFKTQVTNPNYYANNNTHTYYNASVILTGGGISESRVNNASQGATSLVLAKSSSAYNYATKTISWTVTVNQNNMHMPNAVVTELVQAGQAYVEGSLRVNGAEPGAMLSVSGGTLTITLGEISAQTVITFNTVITDQSVFLSTDGNVTFRNNVQLSTGVTGAPTVSVWADRVVINTPVTKNLLEEYVPANGYIGWSAYVNPNQTPMLHASLTDVLQDGLELDTESVHLYYWNQSADGLMSVGAEVSDSDYSFTYDYGMRRFVINLPDGAQGYYLTFKTDVLKSGRYSNTIGFSGSYNGSDDASSAYNVSASDISVSGSGWNGSITVIKTDKNGQPITTPAVFELLDSMKNVKATLTTDANGRAVFTKLKLRTYYIREKVAPTGYALDTTEYAVTISGTNEQTLNPTLSVGDEALVAAIILHKTDEFGKALSGGRFSVYLASDTGFKSPLQSVSAVDGVIRFTDLEAGDYIVREVSAPAGFKLWEGSVAVSLVIDEEMNTLSDAIVEEPIINLPGFGSIEFMKVNRSNAPLAGAKFGLYWRGSLIDTAVSGSDGIVRFDDVQFGTYTVKEISAPTGYAVSGETFVVQVTHTGVNRANPYAHVNSLIPIGAPQTGGVDAPAGGILLIALASLLLMIAQRRDKNC